MLESPFRKGCNYDNTYVILKNIIFRISNNFVKLKFVIADHQQERFPNFRENPQRLHAKI